jgi:imidazolonepropionase-like amidohydrolase
VAPIGPSLLPGLVLAALSVAGPSRALGEATPAPPIPPAAPRLAASDATREPIAIVGARVNTLAGPPIDHATVVVRAGSIVAVGAGAGVPSGARVLEGEGLVVTPGFFDAMSTLGLSEIPSVAATQDTAELGAWNPHLRALDAVNPASEHILVARANGVTHAGTAPAGTTASGIGYGIPGRASAIRLDGWTNQEMAIAPEIGVVLTWPSLVTRRFDPASARFSDRPFAEAKKEYDDRIAELRSWLASARRYASASRTGKTSRTPNDLRLAGLADVAQGRLPILVRADRERQIREAVDFAAGESLRMILIGGKEAWRVAPLLAEKKVPVILGPTQDLPLEEDDPYDRPFTLARDLRAAGVQIAISTFGAMASFTLPYEAGQAVAFGLPWDDGVAAITRAPAEIFGLGDRLGTLEPGKVANLIVTDGDPLEIRTRVLHVMIDGRWVDLANKQSRSYERYRSRPLPVATPTR